MYWALHELEWVSDAGGGDGWIRCGGCYDRVDWVDWTEMSIGRRDNGQRQTERDLRKEASGGGGGGRVAEADRLYVVGRNVAH